MTAGAAAAAALPLDELLAFAHDLADAADAVTMRHFGGQIAAERKPDGSPVTLADREVEQAVRMRIAQRYPDHAVLGEEGGGALDPSVPTWVVDPIDSTKNFMRGLPMFATLIGVVHGGRAVVGLASVPAMGERWWAAQGRGAHRDGTRVRVSDIDEVAHAHALFGGLDWFRSDAALWERLGRISELVWRTRGFGDFWMHLLVAGGHAEAAFERDLNVWDVAALECIVNEAGGRLTSWDGGSALLDGNVLATNGRLHAEFQELLTGQLPEPPG